MIPFAAGHALMKHLRYTGLPVYNDHIIGGAYSFYPPHRGPNWKDRLFAQMARHELEKHYVTGRRALYELVDIGSLGMELEQTRHWPRKNPLAADGDTTPDARSPLVSVSTMPSSAEARLRVSSGEKSGSCVFSWRQA